jgi:hypothetical protein
MRIAAGRFCGTYRRVRHTSNEPLTSHSAIWDTMKAPFQLIVLYKFNPIKYLQVLRLAGNGKQ